MRLDNRTVSNAACACSQYVIGNKRTPTKNKLLTRKFIFVFFLILVFINWGFSQFSKYDLQTSDILELHKDKKYKAIFRGEKITVHDNYKNTTDTMFFRSVYGEFILFKHDSINSSDSLLIIPSQINVYYFVSKTKETILLTSQSFTDKKPIKIYFYSILKIIKGRKTYKMRATKPNEKVWF